MKRIFLLSLLVCHGFIVQAQKPKPQHEMNVVLQPSEFFASSSQPLDIGIQTGYRIQSLYYPSEFPGMPTGFINSLYLRAGRYSKYKGPYPYDSSMGPIAFTNFYIGMANYHGSDNADSLRFEGTVPLSWHHTDTLLYVSFFVMPPPIDSGDWLKISLQKPFYYNGYSNFIVDIAHDSIKNCRNSKCGLEILGVQLTGAQPRIYLGVTYPAGYPIGKGNGPRIVGFDIVPASITGVSLLEEIQVHPNPTSGKFTVSFSASRKINEVSVSIATVTGSKVIQESFKEVNNNFSHAIDLSEMAKGVYFIEVKADGERVVRKVVVE